MSINTAYLTWNAIVAPTASVAEFRGKNRWTYEDTSKTLSQLENEQGDTAVAKLLHLGDLVKVIGSDGEQLAYVYGYGMGNPTYHTRNWSYITTTDLWSVWS